LDFTAFFYVTSCLTKWCIDKKYLIPVIRKALLFITMFIKYSNVINLQEIGKAYSAPLITRKRIKSLDLVGYKKSMMAIL
jgi:hypothetical protein